MKKLLLLFIFCLFFAGIVSADWNDLKSYDPITNTITIENWFGLGAVQAEYTLVRNTDQCLTYCFAEGNLTLYMDKVMFDGVEFKNQIGETKQINDFKWFILVEDSYDIEIPTYEDVCDFFGNGSQYCEKVQNGTITQQVITKDWQRYFGEVLPAGNYTWKLEGRKDIDERIDWIASAFGKDFTEWAWWDSDWSFRRTYNMTEFYSENHTNEPVIFLINASLIWSKIQSDGEDLRIINVSNDYEFPLLVTMNTTIGGNIEINFNYSLSADDNSTQFYLYYGNPAATAGASMTPAWQSVPIDSSVGELNKNHDAGCYVNGAYNANGCTALNNSLYDGNPGAAGGVWYTTADGQWAVFRFDANYIVGRVNHSNPCPWPDGLNANYLPKDYSVAYSLSTTMDKSASWTWVVNRTGDATSGCAYNVSYFKPVVAKEMLFQADDSQLGGANIEVAELEYYAVAPLNFSAQGGEETLSTLTTILNSPANNTFNNNVSNLFNWTVAVLSTNISNSTLSIWYDNGTLFQTNFTSLNVDTNYTFERTINGFVDDTYIWNVNSCGLGVACSLSENRTLTVKTTSPNLLVFYPTGTFYHYQSNNISLNWSVNDSLLDTCWFNYGGKNTTVVCNNNQTYFNVYNISDDSLTFYANDTANNINQSTITWDYKLWEWNNSPYNQSSYSTAQETFWLNFTYNSTQDTILSAYFYYNGVYYEVSDLGSGDNGVFNYSLNTPIIASSENITFFWNVSLNNATGTTLIQTKPFNQTVTNLIFQICDGTYTTPFLNITFADEADSSVLNATMESLTLNYWIGTGSIWYQYLYSNTTLNFNYTLCALPNATYHNNITMQYASPGYPQRRSFLTTDRTNTMSTEVLYLLSSSTGIYSVYQVQDVNGNAIQDVKVSAERLIGGLWVQVETGITDGAGAVTFWLNPNYDHRLTFTKTGYSSFTTTLRPSSSIYTVVLTGGASSATFNSTLADGVTWKYGIVPFANYLTQNTTYTFWFWVNSTSSNLVGYKMELLNENGVVYSTKTGAVASGSNLTAALNVYQNKSIRGRYSIDTGDGYVIVDADSFWSVTVVNIPTRGTIASFISNLNRVNFFGSDDGRAQYSKSLLFFIFFFMILGAISYSTGWDFATAGGAIALLYPIVLVASLAGFFDITFLPPGASSLASAAFIQRYSVAIITGLFSGGYIFNKWAEGRQG